MVGELFLIDDPKELGALVRDTSRYEGTLSQEDLYELGEFSLASVVLSLALFPKPPTLRKRPVQADRDGDISLACVTVQRRADWQKIERLVDKAVYGLECLVC